MFNKLIEYMAYDFVQYAVLTGTLIALCSALIGSVIVTQKMSFIGDGLSHIAFGSTSIATIIGLANNIYITLPVTILFSIFLFKSTESRKTPSDALLAVISVGGLAFGYISLNLFSSSSNVSGDVCGFLFGATSILTLTKDKVILCCILAVVSIAFFVVFYNKIYAVTFDETFSKSCGENVKLYKMLIAILIDIIIVLSMNLVGALLISALIILPTLSSIRVCNSFKAVILSSSIFSVVGALLGLLTAILYGTPVGCTIVAADLFIFIICFAVSIRKVVL